MWVLGNPTTMELGVDWLLIECEEMWMSEKVFFWCRTENAGSKPEVWWRKGSRHKRQGWGLRQQCCPCPLRRPLVAPFPLQTLRGAVAPQARAPPLNMTRLLLRLHERSFVHLAFCQQSVLSDSLGLDAAANHKTILFFTHRLFLELLEVQTLQACASGTPNLDPKQWVDPAQRPAFLEGLGRIGLA